MNGTKGNQSQAVTDVKLNKSFSNDDGAFNDNELPYL